MIGQATRRSPLPRWASVAVLLLVVLYAATQPLLNERFGWRLPGLGEAEPAGEQADPRPEGAAAPPTEAAGQESDDQELGVLRDIGGRVQLSAAGLRYTPGGPEGHRLDHVLRHSEDDPSRPGSHGVFDGGRQGTLRTIDEAYLAARRGGRGVRIERDGDRVVYTVDLGRRIGFVGGEQGRRNRHPDAEKVRLVLEGDRVITAYPLR